MRAIWSLIAFDKRKALPLFRKAHAESRGGEGEIFMADIPAVVVSLVKTRCSSSVRTHRSPVKKISRVALEMTL